MKMEWLATNLTAVWFPVSIESEVFRAIFDILLAKLGRICGREQLYDNVTAVGSPMAIREGGEVFGLFLTFLVNFGHFGDRVATL